MAISALLIHSPLVGPSSWARAADVLLSRGSEVAVPDLTRVTESSPPWWRMLVDTAVAATADLAPPIVVVGHSGAGAFLPAIGERLRGRLGSDRAGRALARLEIPHHPAGPRS